MTEISDITVLRLHGMGVPLYSARGLSQTLSPIDESVQMLRTVNGDLDDLSVAQFRKFKSTITGSDQQPPALNGIWPGTQIIVDCIVEIAYETSTGGPNHTVVDGSTRVEGDYTFYRPQLTMRLVNFNVNRDEYGAQVGWSLDLAEA